MDRYLVLQRPRAVGRHELIEAIWAGDLPADHASALTVLLSKLRAAGAALCARYVTPRPLLPDHGDLPWLASWRLRLDEALDGALEAYAGACSGLGGTEIAGAERAARRLLEHNPLRETGYS
jgi:hypothetical protein